MFPKQDDPKGDPEKWTEDEMKRWLIAVSPARPFFTCGC